MVAVSAHITTEIEKKALACGFDEVVESPLTFDRLQKIIKEQVYDLVKRQLVFQLSGSESSDNEHAKESDNSSSSSNRFPPVNLNPPLQN